MLEKLNALEVHEAGTVIVKHFTDERAAKAERVALAALGDQYDTSENRLLRVPPLGADHGPLSVSMGLMKGVRFYDVIAGLNAVIRTHPSPEMVGRAHDWKMALVEVALESVAIFQRPEVQLKLRRRLGGITSVYDFEGKLSEASDYVVEVSGFASPPGLREDVAAISEVLRGDAEVLFRDASLKNFVLDPPMAMKYDIQTLLDESRRIGMHRPSDFQWTDSESILHLLQIRAQELNISERCYHIDFESAADLTTRQDDFLHILCFEIPGLGEEYARDVWERRMGFDEERFNYAVLFRCFREWARRLFYRRDRPHIFPHRYLHESVSFNFWAAMKALHRLRANSAAEGTLRGMESLMRRMTPHHEPWHWWFIR